MKILKNSWLTVTTIILALFLVFIFDIFVRTYGCQDKFLQMRLFEVIQLTATIVIATFFSYFISKRLGNNGKIKELIDETLRNLRKQIDEIFILSIEYMKAPDKELEDRILSRLKIAYGQIDLAERLRDEKSLKALRIDSDFKLKYINFKESITDSPFGDDKKRSFSNERESRVHKEYCEILHAIDDLRFGLFKDK